MKIGKKFTVLSYNGMFWNSAHESKRLYNKNSILKVLTTIILYCLAQKSILFKVIVPYQF